MAKPCSLVVRLDTKDRGWGSCLKEKQAEASRQEVVHGRQVLGLWEAGSTVMAPNFLAPPTVPCQAERLSSHRRSQALLFLLETSWNITQIRRCKLAFADYSVI